MPLILVALMVNAPAVRDIISILLQADVYLYLTVIMAMTALHVLIA